MSQIETQTPESTFEELRRLSPKVTGGITRMREETDHAGYMVPYSFICLSAMLVFQDPTPAVRPS